jgi:hypothetical protein
LLYARNTFLANSLPPLPIHAKGAVAYAPLFGQRQVFRVPLLPGSLLSQPVFGK